MKNKICTLKQKTPDTVLLDRWYPVSDNVKPFLEKLEIGIEVEYGTKLINSVECVTFLKPQNAMLKQYNKKEGDKVNTWAKNNSIYKENSKKFLLLECMKIMIEKYENEEISEIQEKALKLYKAVEEICQTL